MRTIAHFQSRSRFLVLTRRLLFGKSTFFVSGSAKDREKAVRLSPRPSRQVFRFYLKSIRTCEAALSGPQCSGLWAQALCIVRQAKASFLGVGWIVACSAFRVRSRHFFLVDFPRLLL